MTTQKEIIKRLKESKENKITVISFENGKRDLMCSGMDLGHAFSHITRQLQLGYQLVVTNEHGRRAISLHEIRNNMKRATYDFAKTYAVKF